MSSTNLGLILAAGNGRRIANVSGELPKPLVELHGRPLLEHVLLGAQQAGIKRFVVVLGYRATAIRCWFAWRGLDGIDVTFVENTEYNKDNGISVLKASHVIHEPFLLMMADHVFEPKTAAALLRQPINNDGAILAVDHKLDQIFDMDDATKVACNGDRVIDIGKDITTYSAVDTGMFVCTPSLFNWLELAQQSGNCSLSQGMRLLAFTKKLGAFDIGNGLWQDVDTPEALAHAEMNFPQHYRPSHVVEDFANV
jgi:1L-myo-inositol 1-phosphate cytidylyltransferase